MVKHINLFNTRNYGTFTSIVEKKLKKYEFKEVEGKKIRNCI
jgi:hypothetical protein